MRHLWQTILVSLLLSSGMATAAEPAVKIALFASGGGRAEVVAGLATARLSTEPAVILLERDDIRRVLAEQHLATDGRLSADTLVKLGQLLNCDVFAVIQIAESAGAVPPRSAAASLTAFDAGTGVRLAAQTLDPAATPEVLTDAVVAATTLALRKWHALGQGRTIALLSIRTVGLNPAMDGLPERLSLSLEQALLATPEFTLLERQRLNHLNTEVVVAGDRRANLLASTVLLALDLSSRGETDGFSLRASLNTLAGKETGSFVVEGTGASLEIAAQTVVLALRKQLAANRRIELTGNDRQREAEQYSAESRRLAAANQYMAAVAPAQASVALSPDNPTYAYYFCDVAERSTMAWLAAKNQAASLEVIAQDLDLRERHGEAIMPALRHHWGENICLEMALLNLCRKAPQFSPAEKARLDELRRRYRRYAQKFKFDTGCGNWWLLQQMLCAASADDWLVATLPAITAQKLPWESLVGWNSAFMGHARKPGNYTCDLLYDLRDLSPQGKRKLLLFFEQQAAGDRPFDARLCGYFSAVQVAAQFPREIPEAPAVYTRHIRAAVDLIVACAGTPQDNNARAYGTFCQFCSSPLPAVYETEYPYDSQAMPKLLLKEGDRMATALAAKKRATPSLWYLLGYLAEYLGRTPGAEVPPPDTFRRNIYHQWMNSDYWFDKDPMVDARERKELMQGLRRENPALFDREPEPAAWWTKTEIRYAVPPGCVILGIAPDYETGDYFLLVCRDGPYEQFIRRVAVGDKTSGTIVTNTPTKTGTDSSYPSLHYRGPETFNASRGFPFNLAVGIKVVYASEAGIVLAWPSDGGEPWVIRVPPGLGGILSFAQAGDHLYWGLTGSGGCLARSTLRGENFEILAASDRREARSPLDNCAGYAIRQLTWDKPRDRVTFFASLEQWEVRLQTREIRRIVGYSNQERSPSPLTPYLSQDRSATEPVGPLLQDSESPLSPPFCTPGNWNACARVGNTLYYTDANRKAKWHRLSRIIGTPPRQVDLPPLNGESPFFMAASGNQLLACTRQNLWLLTPPVSK